MPIPRQQSGAFDLFAWQWVWVMGMWLGARSVEGPLPLRFIPKWGMGLAAAVCLFFAGIRHAWGILLDTWQIGPLRMINLIAFVSLLYGLRGAVRWLISREPFITLGRASLEVFCAHLVFVFVGLALLYGEIPQLHGIYAIALLVITFIGLIFVAQRQVRRKQADRKTPSAPEPVADVASCT